MDSGRRQMKYILDPIPRSREELLRLMAAKPNRTIPLVDGGELL